MQQISATVNDIYGFDVSEGFISDVTDKIIPQIEEWHKRLAWFADFENHASRLVCSSEQTALRGIPNCLYRRYPLFGTGRQYGKKLAVYVILGINSDGIKEVLCIPVGENESSKYRLTVLNFLKNRGVKDKFLLCANGLTGMREAVGSAFPQAEYQRYIVHQIRNTMKYVVEKNRKEFASDLKTHILGSRRASCAGSPGVSWREMGNEIRERCKKLGTQLGYLITHLQFFCPSQKGRLYHKCHRKPKFNL